MRKFIIALSLLFVGEFAAAETIIYLHGRIIELEGVQAVHERFGLYDYLGTLTALQQNGATVIAEVRSADTQVEEYARRVVATIEGLIESGEPATEITVVGFSKGGAIAVYVSDLLHRPEVNFVFLAACSSWLTSQAELRVSGNILSIYEGSDSFAGSCEKLVQQSDGVSSFHELQLSTGKEHGAFYLPRAVWVDPLLSWIDGDSE